MECHNYFESYVQMCNIIKLISYTTYTQSKLYPMLDHFDQKSKVFKPKYRCHRLNNGDVIINNLRNMLLYFVLLIGLQKVFSLLTSR